MIGRTVIGRGRARLRPSPTESSGYVTQPSGTTPSPNPGVSRDTRQIRTEASTVRDEGLSACEQMLAEAVQQCVIEPRKTASHPPVNVGEPVRAQGTTGTATSVQTNCIKLTRKHENAIHQYEVQILPEVDDSRKRYKLVSMAVSMKRGIRNYDGDKILYLPYKIANSRNNVELDGTSYQIIVTLRVVLAMEQSLGFFGTLIKNCCRAIGLHLVGRSYYDLQTERSIAQYNYKVWSGFVTSVDSKEDGVYLTVDTSSRVLRTNTALMVMRKIQQSNPQNFRAMVTKELTGITVMTHYNNLMYRVDDILWDGNPVKTTFELLNGTTISLKDYVYKQHKIELMDDMQPILVAKSRNRGPLKDSLVYLIPELCQMTGITDEMRKDYQVMKELLSLTMLDPGARARSIKDLIKKIKDNDESRMMLENWGLEIADEGAVVRARILPPIDLTFGNNQLKVQGDWKNSYAPYRGVNIDNWVIFYVSKDRPRVEEFLDTLKAVARGLSIAVAEPKLVMLPNDRVSTIIPSLQNNTTERTQIIVYVMSSQRTDIYTAVKKFCICDKPMASQMVLSYTLSKRQRLRAVTNNILLQMVAKLGGALWKVEIKTKDTMFCGIDTYHDKGGKHSVAGFVAGVDKESTKYYTQVNLQDPSIDFMLSTYRSVTGSINAYYEENGKPPERMFIFRDGVSVGDFLAVQKEIEYIKKACRDYHENYEPKIIFIICVKRIGIRYWTQKGTNVEPGTVLDSSVTMRNYKDFMIVSQKGSKGTLTPTHYVILCNESNLTIDQIQRITHWFCHMYYNWSGAVRVPAPCLYAHKVAALIGVIQKYPDMSMENRLYYL